MTRLLLIVTLLSVATLAGAQGPPAPPAKSTEPSPGDKCLADLPIWQAYASNLKASRDTLEQDLATVRTQLAAAQAKLAELEKKK